MPAVKASVLVVACGVALAVPRAAAAQAANYELIRFDAGLVGGYSGGLGAGAFGGLVEPKVMIHDNISVGAHLEGLVTFGASVSRESDELSMSSGSVGTFLAKGEYYVGTLAVRPVLGLSAGLYMIGGETIESGANSAGVSAKAGKYFGVAPQIGIDLGRVRLAATYHAILGADIEVEQVIGDAESTRDFSQNYTSFELSFHFGGTRLDPRPSPPAQVVGPPGSASR